MKQSMKVIIKYTFLLGNINCLYIFKTIERDRLKEMDIERKRRERDGNRWIGSERERQEREGERGRFKQMNREQKRERGRREIGAI